MTQIMDNINNKQPIKGVILLLLTSALWGTAFVFQKNAASSIDAFTFNFLRFSIAIPILSLLRFLPKHLFIPKNNSTPQKKYKLFHLAWFIGIVSGLFMFFGITLQQLGLTYTTAGKSGLLTSLYIILVPILALFIGQRCHTEVWLATLLTFFGIYLLSNGGVTNNLESQFNTGDILTLFSAIAWALQVLWLGTLARYANILTIVTLQVIVVALFSAIVIIYLLITQDAGGYYLPTWQDIWSIKIDILYTGIVSSAIAFTLQVLGQSYISATNAALLMSTEAVFALIIGVIFLKEIITPIALLGCLCILFGIVIAQLQGKFFVFIKNLIFE